MDRWKCGCGRPSRREMVWHHKQTATHTSNATRNSFQIHHNNVFRYIIWLSQAFRHQNGKRGNRRRSVERIGKLYTFVIASDEWKFMAKQEKCSSVHRVFAMLVEQENDGANCFPTMGNKNRLIHPFVIVVQKLCSEFTHESRAERSETAMRRWQRRRPTKSDRNRFTWERNSQPAALNGIHIEQETKIQC